ncbi:cupin domain-containing protein [Streptomyces lincolnensis]|uniref:cupin domain-containing protein n=1 Tax=Streptomyces lincolnensis TaxID=1915 RepID=UPI0037D7D7D0
MHIRNLDRDNLRHENGLDAQRLLPWPALNAPFEGSWCIVKPGTASIPHAHHDYEIFIALTGTAVLETGGRRRSFAAGDIAYFEPGTEHSVVNESTDQDFEMYSIWWDPGMADTFRDRHGRTTDGPALAPAGVHRSSRLEAP